MDVEFDELDNVRVIAIVAITFGSITLPISVIALIFMIWAYGKIRDTEKRLRSVADLALDMYDKLDEGKEAKKNA